ncbi:MAG: hypothetical protein AB8F74_12590 [Saprospiraceae bacterium]
MTRSELVTNLRPKVPVLVTESKNEIEDFMHFTLRPVLKFQHATLIRCIKVAPHFQHLKFKEGKETKNRTTLNQFLQKNSNLKNQLIGVTIGLFTDTELDCYERNMKELNKRIIEMAMTRFLSQV